MMVKGHGILQPDPCLLSVHTAMVDIMINLFLWIMHVIHVALQTQYKLSPSHRGWLISNVESSVS